MKLQFLFLTTLFLVYSRVGSAQFVCRIPTSGTDFGSEVQTCATGFLSTGGTIDATNATGSQTCKTSFTLYPSTVLKLGAGTTISGICTITMGKGTAIEGAGATGTYADGASNAAVVWDYKGTASNFITLAGGTSNAYAVRLSNVRFVGPLALSISATAGNGLYASPGSGYSNVGVTLDHVTFQGFYGDGIHLEDNVYFVDCFGCAAEQNGGYGWFQAPNLTTTAPSQVNLYSIKLNSNGLNGSSYAQLYAGGGASEGELKIFGGTIANDLSPGGAGPSCLTFAANNNQQMNAWLSGVHIESCGQSAGGQFIDWNAAHGVLSVHDSYFVNPSGKPAYPINLDSSFGGSAFIGPGNFYSTPSQPTPLYNQNSSTTGTVAIYDQIGNVGGTIPDYLSGFGFLNNSFAYPSYIFGQKRFVLNNAGLYFVGGSTNFSLFNSTNILFLTDTSGNNIAAFSPSGSPTVLYQSVMIGGGGNVVYRCTTAGALPVGALTVSSSNCGASTDTSLRVK